MQPGRNRAKLEPLPTGHLLVPGPEVHSPVTGVHPRHPVRPERDGSRLQAGSVVRNVSDSIPNLEAGLLRLIAVSVLTNCSGSHLANTRDTTDATATGYAFSFGAG